MTVSKTPKEQKLEIRFTEPFQKKKTLGIHLILQKNFNQKKTATSQPLTRVTNKAH